MRLVYQNNENPYYEYDKYARNKFEEVVTAVKFILFPPGRNAAIDDKCGGIISEVYGLYDEKDWHTELIICPVQIQVQFDDSKEKLRELQDMFKILFAFFDLFVIPELERFNSIQNFNKLSGLLNNIHKLNLKLSKPKKLRWLFKNRLTIVTTNTSKIFLSN